MFIAGKTQRFALRLSILEAALQEGSTRDACSCLAHELNATFIRLRKFKKSLHRWKVIFKFVPVLSDEPAEVVLGRSLGS